MKTTNDGLNRLTWLLWLAILGPEWANLLYYSGFGAGVIGICTALINFAMGFSVPLWLGLSFGAVVGALYGFDKASRNAENLSHYLGWKALFPELVLKHFVASNTSLENTQPNIYRLIIEANIWRPKDTGKYLSAGGSRDNTFVPDRVFVAYFEQNFPVMVDPGSDTVRFYFLRKQPTEKADNNEF